VIDPAARPSPDDPVEDLTAQPGAAVVLGDAASYAPHAELRARVLAAATAARAPGGPRGGPDPMSPTDAFRRTQADLTALVDDLSDSDARSITIEGWTVAGLLGHLTAIEQHFGARLGWWEEPEPIELEHDHLAMTLDAVRIAEATPFEEVRHRWRDVVHQVTERMESLEERRTERLMFNGFDFSIRSLIIVRTFEVWTHLEDIHRATGRSPRTVDPARLRLMSDAAVRALPIGMLLADRSPRGRTVRIVLTGEGGGAWVQSLELGDAPAETNEPELTLTAAAIEFCRLAARRTAPGDLDCSIVGDPDLAADVLAAAAVFAA
jgi:uncharacterized protein (TIGR03083 family)